MSLGKRIRKKRKEKGLTLEKLGEMAKSSKTHMYCLETGRTTNPSIDIISQIAISLDVTIDYLVFGDKCVDKI